ncbi:hypothetical protein ABVT39_000534 [Epinephelus coioides]
MALKQLQMEVNEMKEAISMLSSAMDKISNQQQVINSLVKEMAQLKTLNVEQKDRIDTLENKVDELEQYLRLNDIIVSGLDIKPKTYAKAAAKALGHDMETSEEERITVEEEVVAFLHSKNINIDRNNIEACHPLPRKTQKADERQSSRVNQMDNPAVILRFFSRKHKMDLLRQGKNLKGTKVYLNEHLTQKNGEIARKARFLKKKNKIQGTWTANCKVFIKLNGHSPEQAKVIVVRKLEDLSKYE